MATIDQISDKYHKAFRDVSLNVITVMEKYGRELLEDFRSRSAVDTGRYQRSWRFMRPKKSGSSYSMTLKNPTPYAYALVGGAKVDGPPWYFSGKGRRTGKLFIGKPRGTFAWWMSGGTQRVWAGGKNPGKSKALGGVKGGLFSNGNFQKKFLTNLGKVVIKGL